MNSFWKEVLQIVGWFALAVSFIADMVSAQSYFGPLVLSISSGCLAVLIFLVRFRQTRGFVRFLFAFAAAFGILILSNAVTRFLAGHHFEHRSTDATRSGANEFDDE